MSVLSEAPCRITAQLLVDNNLCGYATNVDLTEPGWCVFCGGMPDDTEIRDSAISVNENPVSWIDGKLMNGETIVKQSLQVRVRSSDRDDAYRKISAIFNFMESVSRELVTVNEKVFRIDNYSMQSAIVFMGNDMGTRRANFMFNTNITGKEILS